jgi:hypothetical protein
MTPFLFLCVFWGISPSRRTQGHKLGSSPNFNMFPCSHRNISFLRKSRKKGGNRKRVVYVRGGSCIHAFSWGSGTPSGSYPRVPLPQGNTLVWEHPLQVKLPSSKQSMNNTKWNFIL